VLCTQVLKHKGVLAGRLLLESNAFLCVKDAEGHDLEHFANAAHMLFRMAVSPWMHWAGSWKKQHPETRKPRDNRGFFLCLSVDHFRGITKMIQAT
jgi:hypothetical protein